LKNKKEIANMLDAILVINVFLGSRLIYRQEKNNKGFANQTNPAGDRKNPNVPENKIASPDQSPEQSLFVQKTSLLKEITNKPTLKYNVPFWMYCFEKR